MAHSEDTVSSSDTEASRFGMTAAGPGGALVSDGLHGDILMDLCNCILYAFFSDDN